MAAMRSPRKAASKAGYPVPRKRKPSIPSTVKEIDHKNIPMIQRYLTEFGQIQGRRRFGNSPATQRLLNQAIKRARHLALIPFVKR